MRYLVMLAIAFTLGACSSSGKKSKEMKGDTAKAEKTTSKKAGKAKKAAAASGDTVKCTGFGVTREIAILKSSEGCSVQYTKDGVMKEVATGSLVSDHCQSVASKIQSNLTENGFTCQ